MPPPPFTWPPTIATSTSDNIANDSSVAGANVTDALDTLAGQVSARASEAAIITKLAPMHWWNANHTVVSGGLVDSVTDLGSVPKDFTQVGAARAALGVDGNAQTYLTFAGAQSYRAGVVADWTFASNGTGCTFAYILSRTALALGFEAILGTVAGDTTKNGFDVYWGFVSATDQGPLFQITMSTLNQYVVYCETAFVALNNAVAVIVRTFGATPPSRTLNGATNNPIAVSTQLNGQPRASGVRNAAYNVGAPTNPLTLGRRADLGAGQFLNARVYDVLIHNNPWSDAECELWLQYARIRQGLPPQYGWPTALAP